MCASYFPNTFRLPLSECKKIYRDNVLTKNFEKLEDIVRGMKIPVIREYDQPEFYELIFNLLSYYQDQLLEFNRQVLQRLHSTQRFQSIEIVLYFFYYLVRMDNYQEGFDLAIRMCEELRSSNTPAAMLFFEHALVSFNIYLKLNGFQLNRPEVLKYVEFSIQKIEKLKMLMPYQEAERKLANYYILQFKRTFNYLNNDLDVHQLVIKGMMSVEPHLLTIEALMLEFKKDNLTEVYEVLRDGLYKQIQEINANYRLASAAFQAIADSFFDQFCSYIQNLFNSKGFHASKILSISELYLQYEKFQCTIISTANNLILKVFQLFMHQKQNLVKDKPMIGKKMIDCLRFSLIFLQCICYQYNS